MAKITRANGPSNEAGITRAAFGGHVDAGLTERAAGFSDDTASTVQAAADQRPETVPPVTGDGRAASVVAPFDPAEWSVADVIAERSNCTDAEWAAVLKAERAGKDRAGIK